MLGFPIVNDTMYGGGEAGVSVRATVETVDAASRASSEALVPRPALALASAPAPTASSAAASSAAAEALCVCCTRGEAAAFSEEQLRREGIMLHALRYDFLESAKEGERGDEEAGGPAPPALLSLEVAQPAWYCAEA